MPNFSAAVSSTLTASAMISGPMPSPGSTRIFLLMGIPCSGDGAEQPGLCGLVAGFKGGDGIAIGQGQADVIQPVQQAVLAESIDFEGVLATLPIDDDLALQID